MDDGTLKFGGGNSDGDGGKIKLRVMVQIEGDSNI